MMSYQQIIEFWFELTQPRQWWRKDESFDQLIKQRYLSVLQQAQRGELSEWRISAAGRLAEIIVLDQFSRNIFRNRMQAFSNDAQALVLAQELVAQNLDQQLPERQRAFAYMPYIHSESVIIHQQIYSRVEALKQPGTLASLKRHTDVLRRFGRYPHRNEILVRQSTQAELEFLNQPGSRF